MPCASHPALRVRAPRADGLAARARLLAAALQLFADKGFASTSTREIAQAAGVNLAAIAYYFDDKAGLYRAAFVEPMGDPRDDIALFDNPTFSLRETLEGYFSSFLAPLKQGQVAQQCVRLHYREMVEPTGLWTELVEGGMRPAHEALVTVLCRHLDLTEPDDEVHRLAFALSGMALQIYIGQDIIAAARPALLATPVTVDQAARRLADFGCAMVRAEMDQRTSTSNPTEGISS
jgi:AcrR family transcriptional regulator